MEKPPPCRLLEWDSHFFGARIGRVEPSRLDATQVAGILAWASSESIDCLYYLADARDRESAHAAEAAGFRLVDARVTRERVLKGVEETSDPELGPVRDEEIDALCAIARRNHLDSRFYCDPRFPDERCDELYATWMRNSCAGEADAVLVARQGGRPVGYVTCELDEQDGGGIGLVGVDPDTRRRGLGSRLVGGALGWFATHGRARVHIVNQGRNVAIARVLERLGFRTRSVEHWYHLWLDR